MKAYLNIQDNCPILEKKNKQQFEKISWYQMLSFWSKDTRKVWKQNKIIDSLIHNRDYSTLFELYKNNYLFTDKQIIKMQKSIDKALIDRNYPDKPGLFYMMEKYKIEILPSYYYHFIVSNSFQDTADHIEKYAQYNIKEPIIDYIKNSLLKDDNFKKGLHEFIIKDIENQPSHLGAAMNWSMSRDCYHQPIKNSYIFEGMTKNQLGRIIKTRIGISSVIKEYQVLLNQAPIDNEVMEQLGINTKSLVARAQKDILLSEDSLNIDMKEKIKDISVEIEKIQTNNHVEYKEKIIKIGEEILPNLIKKYLSIDEEYRHSLRNVEGKLPSQLLMESLDNIFAQLKEINQEINKEKISSLSIENRKLKN